MKIINLLPLHLDCLRRWKELPSLAVFKEELYEKVRPYFEEPFGNEEEIYEYFKNPPLPWSDYRSQALKLNPEGEEKRLLHHLSQVSDFFNLKLEGEVILFAMFSYIDGYARFDKGSHRVFLGLSTVHTHKNYYDILETHELTHVARESRPETWLGWGLNPKASNDEFVENQPVLEHLFGEGFSCVISEKLNPHLPPWEYVYQTKETFELVMRHAQEVDRVVHEEIQKEEQNPKEADYSKLYHSEMYLPPLPLFTQYVWAYAWVKELLKSYSTQELLRICSKDLRQNALNFKLSEVKIFNP